ncbi:DUF2158 domain-containing protein [Phyllobacterium leguminum]|uniref:Uncharacterized protein DUF2158 n=1 Tax=Phyllobacterium leguminum TaxID=314237 RepID=A0A318T403_9HYPH|nr:DUF2158 domain-containing protein [Phyllobacterium leguminum]PYE89603.1 uncharacterized protein DUF2158 [Phyllobacterium leguminum]
MAEEIKVGSVVRLKSGGPHMTVSSVGKPTYSDTMSAWCDWFVQDKAPWKKDQGVFPLTSLTLIEQ